MSRLFTVAAVIPGTRDWLASMGSLRLAGDEHDTHYLLERRYVRPHPEGVGGRRMVGELYAALTGRDLERDPESVFDNLMERNREDDELARALVGGVLYVPIVDERGQWEGAIRASTAAEVAEATQTLERLEQEPAAAAWREWVRAHVQRYLAFYRSLEGGEEVVYQFN